MSLRGIQENGDGESTAHMEKINKRTKQRICLFSGKDSQWGSHLFFFSPDEGQRNSSGEIIPDFKKKMCEYSCWKILFQHNFRIYFLFCWLQTAPPPPPLGERHWQKFFGTSQSRRMSPSYTLIQLYHETLRSSFHDDEL